MKTAGSNIQAVKNKRFYSKIYSIYQTDQIYLDIWHTDYKCTELISF